MARMNWGNQHARELARLGEQQEHEADARLHGSPRPARVSKAEQRAEIERLTAQFRPWGRWSEWCVVTRPDGTTYQERMRSRVR